MTNKFNFKAIKELTSFSIPIIFGQLGVMLISVGDMYVAGSHSTLSVGAIGTATGVFNPVFLFGLGLMMGISPSLAIERGKGEDVKIHFYSILVYAILSGIFLSGVMLVVNEFVPMMGINPEMVPLIQKYNKIIAWSFSFAYVFQAVKEYLQSFEDVFFANLLSIISVFVNVGFNYLFVYGYKSFEGLGFDGLAYASFSIRVFMALIILIYAKKYIGKSQVSFAFIKETLKFSFPIAFMFFFEVSAFCLTSILAGGMGVAMSAANTIIMNVASVTFMVPLSICSAVGVKVGAAFGEKDFEGVRNFSYSAIFMSLTFMIFSAGCYFLFPEFIIKLISEDVEVVKIGVSLLMIVGVFQLVDGLQVTLTGILRGLSKTKESFLSILIGYWFIGIPFGIYLAYEKKMQAQGLWIGLALSLMFGALFLSHVFRKQLKSINSK